MVSQLLTPDAKASITTFGPLSTNLTYNQVEVGHSVHQTHAIPTAGVSSIASNFTRDLKTTTSIAVYARDPTSTTMTTVEDFTTTEVRTSLVQVVQPLTVGPGPIGPVTNAHISLRTATSTIFHTFTSASLQTSTSSGRRTVTTVRAAVSSETGLSSSPPNSGPSASRIKAIAGGVAGVTITIILGLVIFCILRRKRRYKATCFASTYETPVSPDAPGQRVRQPTWLTITTQPFLEFRATQEHSSSKGPIADRAGNSLGQKSRGDIEQAVGNNEQAVDPFRDPVPAEGSSPDNNDDGQRATNALVRLQASMNQFEGEFQQLRALAQCGQLSSEDRLRLEEIRRTASLMMIRGSWRDRSSNTGSVSRSSSPSTMPPSYRSSSI